MDRSCSNGFRGVDSEDSSERNSMGSGLAQSLLLLFSDHFHCRLNDGVPLNFIRPKIIHFQNHS